MAERVNDLYETLRRPIIARIARQFGNFEVETEINECMANAEIFRRLAGGRGRKKSHCSNAYPNHEGKLKDS
jgi:hypothetical protein